jgi:hypothetical protein
MSVLDQAIVLPQWIFFVVVLVAAASTIILLFFLMDNKKWCPERNILVKARKKGIPIIEITDLGSNQIIWELGEKTRPDDIAFKSSTGAGIRIDPILVSSGCEPKRFNGANIYSYAFESFLPQTTKNHIAYKTILRYRHEKCKDLEFLQDVEFIELITRPQNHLEHDALMFLTKYFTPAIKKDEATGKEETVNIRQYYTDEEDESTREIDNNGNPIPGTGKIVRKLCEEEYKIDEFIKRIEDIKGDIYRLPLDLGYYAGTEAFVNNANGYIAQDLEALLSMRDKQNILDMIKKINLMTYGVIAIGIIMASCVGIYILHMTGA